MDKRKAYLGFALRAGKLILGVNAVQAAKRDVYLLVADESASSNTKKQIESIVKKLECPIVWVQDLEALTGKAYCKLAAVREQSLARAILEAGE